MRALAVYLHEYQLVPLAWVSELLADLCACEVSEGTVLPWVEFAVERLVPTVAQIADWLSASPLQHADETGVRIAGKLQWLHVNSTRFLTRLVWHTKRGRKALEDIGIWPRFRGLSVDQL
jgi:transposase